MCGPVKRLRGIVRKNDGVGALVLGCLVTHVPLVYFAKKRVVLDHKGIVIKCSKV